MRETVVTEEQIVQSFVDLSKKVLEKEELSEANMLLIHTIVEVKDQFVSTMKPDNYYIDIRPNPVRRNEMLVLAFEIRLTMVDYGSKTKLVNNRVLIVGEATNVSRPENVTVVCCRQVDGSSLTLHHKEMMNGEIDVQVVNDGFNFLMFDILPSNEEVKHTFH